MDAVSKTREQLLSEINALRQAVSFHGYPRMDKQPPTSPMGVNILVRAFYLSPIAMAIVARDNGCLLEVNQGFCRTTGYQPQEIIGRNIDTIPLFADLEGRPLVNLPVKDQETEVQYRAHTGEYRLAMLMLEEFMHDDTPYILVSFSDITPRKHMEKELIKSKEQLRQIINASPVPIALTTLHEGRYLDVNDTFAAQTGYSRDEIIGKTVKDINFFVGIKREEYVDRLLAGETINNMDIVARARDGKIGYALMSSQIYMVDELPCILSTVIDITERKLTEQALAESEARFHSVFNYSPTMMVITRADNGKIIDANAAWLQTMGYNLQDVIGKSATELNIWVDDARYQISSSIEQNGKLDTTELCVRTRSGEILHTFTSAVQTTVNNVLCVLTYSVDITEQRRIQSELARLDQLNLIGQMAASLGHEVRNPMTTVRGFLQMLQDQESNTGKREYFELMIDELDQANRIISAFLALAHDKKVDRQRSSLNKILEQIYPLLRAEALLQEKCISYCLEDVPELWLDENEIRQLIINLTNNGLEAMAPGGCLKIATAMENGRAVLSISDEGKGIAPGLVDRLGTPFFSTKQNGVGLGLAICYSIAQRHEAKIDFVSDEQGTIFRVHFEPGRP